MARIKINPKVLVIDIVGTLLIIGSLLLGWLPGPGGVPLLIAGLGLLSVNHEWARRWIKIVEQKGTNISAKVFHEGQAWQLGIDIFGALVLSAGIWLFVSTKQFVLYAAAFSLLCCGLVCLVGNRKRLRRLKQFFKAQAK